MHQKLQKINLYMVTTVLSGRHSGVAISGYQYMWDSVANQSFASNLLIFCLHPMFYPSRLAFQNDVMVLDGFLLFLIILILLETSKGGSESHEAKVILRPNNSSETKPLQCVELF